MKLQSSADTTLRACLFFICLNKLVSPVLRLRLLCFHHCASCSTDLEDFKTHRRSPVRVREGQGVVLLCGPPPHSGGKMAHRAVVFIAIVQPESLPPRANISSPRSARSQRRFLRRNTGGALSLPLVLICSVFIGTEWKARCWSERLRSAE